MLFTVWVKHGCHSVLFMWKIICDIPIGWIVQVTGSPELLLFPFLTEILKSGSTELLLLLFFFNREVWQPRTTTTSVLAELSGSPELLLLLSFLTKMSGSPELLLLLFFKSFLFLTEMSDNPEFLWTSVTSFLTEMSGSPELQLLPFKQKSLAAQNFYYFFF